MDIQSLSREGAQSQVLEQVGLTMLSKSLKGEEDQAAELLSSLGSAAPLPDAAGGRVDLFA